MTIGTFLGVLWAARSHRYWAAAAILYLAAPHTGWLLIDEFAKEFDGFSIGSRHGESRMQLSSQRAHILHWHLLGNGTLITLSELDGILGSLCNVFIGRVWILGIWLGPMTGLVHPFVLR